MSNDSKFDLGAWVEKMRAVESIWIDILEEHARQEEKFPGQHHPDGTGPGIGLLDFRKMPRMDDARDSAQLSTDRKASLGLCTWMDIAREEVFEAFAETDPVKLRAELIQSLAVMVHWVQDIDSRGKENS